KPTKGSATNDAACKISEHGSKEELVPAAAEDKLKLYGLFKQAKEGDNTASAPWSVQWETTAKWDAWEKNKGKSKEAAMTEYIAEVEVQKLGRTKAHAKARGRLRPKPLLSAKEGEVWHPSSLSGRLRDWSSFGDTSSKCRMVERAHTADLV
ncbi:ACBP3, partial [Symbiodinium necroappetens]